IPSFSCLLVRQSMLLVLVEPQQRFEQVIVAVDQRAVVGARARSVAQHARRRLVVGRDGRQIPINERLRDALARAPIQSSARLVWRQLGQAQQSARDERGGRCITITKVYTLINK